jgi:hypothetical protein
MARVEPGTVIEQAGNLPSSVWLIAEGKVEFLLPDHPPRTYLTDAFFGLRDTLHQLPLEGDFVAAAQCLLISFDPTQLMEFADNSSVDVVAVLERME